MQIKIAKLCYLVRILFLIIASADKGVTKHPYIAGGWVTLMQTFCRHFFHEIIRDLNKISYKCNTENWIKKSIPWDTVYLSKWNERIHDSLKDTFIAKWKVCIK